MVKEEKINIENLESLNVGLVGHVDHGKTTLLEKLTGKWADTHTDELKRGITVKLGYADCVIRKGKEYNTKKGKPVRYISFVDAPGHEMLMATMLSGAAMIDAAVLLIAANEGIKPQTREHLMALQAKNVENIIVVQNKIDLVDKEEASKNYKEIKEFLRGTIAENSPVIPCSALQEVNIDKVLESLIGVEIPERKQGKPVFIVARSFDVNKPGTSIDKIRGGVLGGVLRRGNIKKGQEIEIKPGLILEKENKITYKTVKTKVLGVFKGKYEVEEAVPGGSLALETELDPVLTKADNLSGCVVGNVGDLPEITKRIKVKFDLFEKVYGLNKEKKVREIKTQEPLLLSINTSITVGNVVSVKDNKAELNLRIPIVPFENESIGIARNIDGHWRLVGVGEILD